MRQVHVYYKGGPKNSFDPLFSVEQTEKIGQMTQYHIMDFDSEVLGMFLLKIQTS